jgi:transcriptional regulator with XRE-family HTH domain
VLVSYKLRLKELMDAKGIGRSELASAIGISYQGVRKVFDSDGAFGSENNLKAAEYFGVNAKWLATGEGSKLAKDYSLNGASGAYQIGPNAPASPAAMEIALLYDLIPADDRIRRVQAYNAATAAILNILQSK